jgi:cold shock protein
MLSFKPAVTYTGEEAEGLWLCRSEAIAAKRMHRSKSGMAVWHLSALEVFLPRQHRSLRMAKGTVKWFNPTKGYGFIQPAGGGGRDVFVHISAVEKAGLSTLNEGQSVEYDEVPNKGKTTAENLKVG